jgi:hypothetical protein
MNPFRSTSSGKIFGIGFNKTGTTTLGRCFDILGLGPVARPQVLHDSFLAPSFHDYFPLPSRPPLIITQSPEDPFGEWPYRAICDEVFDHHNHALALDIAVHFRAFHDRPWNIGDLYQALDRRFPGSRFILTWRDAEIWWRSTSRWLTVQHAGDEARMHRFLKHVGADRVDRDRFVSAYLEHNRAVRAYFGDRPDFLAINFEQGDGWNRLCDFLGVPIPTVDFPHENAGQR